MAQHISIFKTSVKNHKDVAQLKSDLDALENLVYWNFDLEDCDNILRVISQIDIKHDIIQTLKKHVFDCIELED